MSLQIDIATPNVGKPEHRRSNLGHRRGSFLFVSQTNETSHC
jgi:hypothetical protein